MTKNALKDHPSGSLMPASYSRRHLLKLAAIGSSFASARRIHAQTPAPTPAEFVPTPLGGNISLNGFRLYSIAGVNRFMIDIQNDGTSAVDTPLVGVKFPDSNASQNFAWATPISPVLHAGGSDCLLGIVPHGIGENDWQNAEWMVCDQIRTDTTDSLSTWNISFSYEVEVASKDQHRTLFEFTNHSDRPTDQLGIQGIIWDKDDLICGASRLMRLGAVKPGMSGANAINLGPDRDYIANPFHVIDSAEDIRMEFSLQPMSHSIGESCPSVLPW